MVSLLTIILYHMNELRNVSDVMKMSALDGAHYYTIIFKTALIITCPAIAFYPYKSLMQRFHRSQNTLVYIFLKKECTI